MAAPKGHPLWGNPLNVKKLTPKELWEGACSYFEWCDKNPWIKEQWVGKDANYVEEKLQRPYSIEALCVHLDISFDTFSNYSKKEGYETYFEVCSRIRKIIDAQHFEGGMVGAFNSNITSKKLGLVDKQEVDNKGHIIAYNAVVSKEEAKSISDALENDC